VGWLLFTRGHVVDRAGGRSADLGTGAILFRSLMVLIVGGSVGETEPPNMLRLLAAQAEPTRARPNIAMTKVRLCQRSRGTSLSRYSSSAASSYTSSIV